jgi:hypothetical protein
VTLPVVQGAIGIDDLTVKLVRDGASARSTRRRRSRLQSDI